MFKFLRALTGEASVTRAKDNILFDETTGYLHFDVEDNNTVERRTIHAPSNASATTYDNTSSGSLATTTQGAIDDLYDNKVDVIQGKGLSTNDYTTADQTKLSSIETGADVNVIESVKVNGVALTPDENKAVNVSVPSTFDASAITSGTFDISRIPQAALERLVHVQNQAARYALTPEDVQLGDTVMQDDTEMMYIVVNILALDSALGYEEYKASVSWNGITDKPSISNSISITLSASNWSNGTYTITNSAINSTVNGYLNLAPSATVAQHNAANAASITITAQSTGNMTLTARGDVPSIDIPVILTLFAD